MHKREIGEGGGSRCPGLPGTYVGELRQGRGIPVYGERKEK